MCLFHISLVSSLLHVLGLVCLSMGCVCTCIHTYIYIFIFIFNLSLESFTDVLLYYGYLGSVWIQLKAETEA